MKFFCSVPVQTAATSSFSPFSFGRVTVEPVAPPLVSPSSFLSLSEPEHAVSARAPASSAASVVTALCVRMVLLLLRITSPFVVLR